MTIGEKTCRKRLLTIFRVLYCHNCFVMGRRPPLSLCTTNATLCKGSNTSTAYEGPFFKDVSHKHLLTTGEESKVERLRISIFKLLRGGRKKSGLASEAVSHSLKP